MTWIRTIPQSEADEALRRALDAQRALYPEEYATPVQPTMIRVYETWSPGSIVKVEVKDVTGQYITVYTSQVSYPSCPHLLEIPVTDVIVKIIAVRISIDQLAHQDWNEIDAVQLVGRP